MSNAVQGYLLATCITIIAFLMGLAASLLLIIAMFSAAHVMGSKPLRVTFETSPEPSADSSERPASESPEPLLDGETFEARS